MVLKPTTYWNISLLLFFIEIISLDLAGFRSQMLSLIVGNAFGLLPFLLYASLFVIAPLYYKKKKQAYHSGLVYSGTLIVISIVELAFIGFNYSGDIGVNVPPIFLGFLLFIILTFIINALLFFSIWESRKLFGVKDFWA